MKFAIKPIRNYPPHLRRVATLPWEIKKSIFVDIQHIWKNTQTNRLRFDKVTKTVKVGTFLRHSVVVVVVVVNI